MGGKAVKEIPANTGPHIRFVPSKARQEAFDRHYSRCMLADGDRVVFKKPKRRGRIYGTIDHIELDIGQMYWTQDGEVPRYIRVAINTVNKDTGEVTGYTYVWTTESKISYVPPIQEGK